LPASSILLLATDSTSAEAVATSLTGVGYTVATVTDSADAIRQAPDHQLVILDVGRGEPSGIDVCREMRSLPSLAQLPILCIAQSDEVEERIRFLEAGADDVVARPFDDRELEARVEALLLRFQRTKALAPIVSDDGTVAPPRARRIVVVFSPKGGVGTTTIATNIAVAAAAGRADRVVLVDLDLQFGQAATHLNLQVRQSLADAVRDEAAMREPELLRTYAIAHDSGLRVLAAPPTPELAELIQPRHVEAILDGVLETYESIVVDAGSILDERTLVALDRADTVILPVNPEIGALKAVHSLLEYLAETGSVGAKTTFVLNNLFAREILRLRDVEGALGAKVGAELPYDPFLYLKAVNEGVPVVRGAPKSAPAEKLRELAASAFGEDRIGASMETAASSAPARKGGLLGALRRR